MRGRERVLVAVGLVVVVVLAGCLDIEARYKYRGTKTETKTFDLNGINTVETRLGSADVEVVTEDTDEATFIIKKAYRATDDDYGRELLEEAVITFEKQGSTLLIERKEPKKVGIDVLTKGYVNIDIIATLPADITLDLFTGSGDLDIDARSAPVKIRTGSGDVVASAARGGFDVRSGSGDIRLGSAAGDVTFSTGSGDIEAGDIEGNTDASAGSGDIDIDTIEGDVRITTGSGDVSIDASSGMATVETGSGDISFGGHAGSAEVTTSSGEVDFCVMPGEAEVSLRTASGDVDIVVYEEDSIDLDISTSNGTITTKVPIAVKDASRRRLHGVSGDGRLKLKISTSSGSVDVRRGSI